MPDAERLLPWVLRLLWLATGLTLSGAVGSAVPAGGGRTAVEVVLAALWLVGVGAMTVPSVRSLTALRITVPLAVPVAASVWIGGAEAVAGLTATAAALLAATVAGSAEVGRAFVQASAYGAEDRHVLRPPAAYAAAAGLSWVVTAAALTTGLQFVARQHPVVGAVVLLGGAATAAWSVPRWHRLSRRWLVVVPAGLVVHDHLVLAETLMIPRHDVAAVGLALAGTDAADLTGPAGGHAVEITTHEPVTAVLAGTPDRPGGRAIHLTACLVAPSRPGRALAAATRR